MYLCISLLSGLPWLRLEHRGSGQETLFLNPFAVSSIDAALSDLLSVVMYTFKQAPKRNKYPYLHSWAPGGSYKIHQEHPFPSDPLAHSGWSRQVSPSGKHERCWDRIKPKLVWVQIRSQPHNLIWFFKSYLNPVGIVICISQWLLLKCCTRNNL